ncbi:MAG TPA: DNA repair protein RecO [Firmicutes bacterium]|nr:DNA repair protein RecO [Bacillota bacterium]
MNLYKTEGLILKSVDFGESDKLITVLSYEYGKLRLLAKGARRVRSRLAGACQQFNLVKFMVFRGKNLDLVSQAEIKESYPVLRSKLDLIAYATCFAELADSFAGECNPERRLFSGLKSAFTALESNVDPELVLDWFGLGCLVVSGYGPQFERCVVCGGRLKSPCGLRPCSGGLVCADCLGEEAEVDEETLHLLRTLMRSSGKELANVHTSVESRHMAGEVVRKLLFAFLEDRPKCFEFLQATTCEV